MSLTLNTKVYTFGGIIQGITSYINRDLGLAALFSVVTASLRIDSMIRETWKLTMPFPVDPESPCCNTDPVAGFCEAKIEIRMSPNVPASVRADFALRLKDLVATTEFQSSITSLVQPAS